VWNPFRKRPDPAEVDLQPIASAPDGPAGDAMVIDALRDAGADLSQPREVVHYLYITGEAAARRAVGVLDRDDRFVHLVIEPEGTPSLIKLTHTMVVTPQSIAGIRAEIEAVATAEGGDYDGWEAAAQP
jgi:hypothetical protein